MFVRPKSWVKRFVFYLARQTRDSSRASDGRCLSLAAVDEFAILFPDHLPRLVRLYWRHFWTGPFRRKYSQDGGAHARAGTGGLARAGGGCGADGGVGAGLWQDDE